MKDELLHLGGHWQALRHPWMVATDVRDTQLQGVAEALRRFHAKRRMKMLRSAVWVRMLLAKRSGRLEEIAAEMEAGESHHGSEIDPN